jgi:hypothetical protein
MSWHDFWPCINFAHLVTASPEDNQSVKFKRIQISTTKGLCYDTIMCPTPTDYQCSRLIY